MNCKYINYIAKYHTYMGDFTKVIELIFVIRELRILIDVNAFI